MATTAFNTNNALAVKVWAKKLYAEVLKVTRYGQFKGGNDAVITTRNELTKGPGDRITIGLRMQLLGGGVVGDTTLEGQEEALTTFSDNLFIDQLRHAVRTAGKMSDQRIAFSVREEGKEGLTDWWADRLDAAFFNQIAGATTTQTQANAVQSAAVDTRYSGMQAAIAPSSNNLMICSAALDTTEASLSATTTFSLKLADIDRAVAKAKTLTPALRPVSMVAGALGTPGATKDKLYVVFVHPFQTYQLRTNTSTGNWFDLQKAAMTGGQIGNNPLITGVLGTYNQCIIVEDSRVPQVASTVTASSSYRRGILCGAQAAAIGFGQNNSGQEVKWVEEEFDYQNQVGISAAMIWGMKKMVFNSQDFSTIVMSGYAPSV